MIYEISYWLHVISSIIWLLALPASLWYAWKAGRSFKAPQEKHYMQNERKVSAWGTHVGALGVLVSGWVLAVLPGGPQWGWFNIPLYNWLALKQLLLIIMLILVAISIWKSNEFKKLVPDGTYPLEEQARKKWKGAYTLSLIIYFMVALNMWLGYAKPI